MAEHVNNAAMPRAKRSGVSPNGVTRARRSIGLRLDAGDFGAAGIKALVAGLELGCDIEPDSVTLGSILGDEIVLPRCTQLHCGGEGITYSRTDRETFSPMTIGRSSGSAVVSQLLEIIADGADAPFVKVPTNRVVDDQLVAGRVVRIRIFRVEDDASDSADFQTLRIEIMATQRGLDDQ